MLRNGDQEPTSRPERSRNLVKRALIVLDVFEDIKCSDNIEFVPERDAAHIHLHEFCIRHAPRRDGQAGWEELRPGDVELRQVVLDCGQDEACPTTDLKERGGFREVVAQSPDDEPVPRPKPETSFLDIGEMPERGFVEALRSLEGIRGKKGNAIQLLNDLSA